jgi:hypothetical protein
LTELASVLAVPPFVALQLWSPVFLASFGKMRDFAAIVPVPKAAVDEDDLFQARENQIRAARQPMIVKTIAEPHAVNHSANRHFRLRILTPDSPHVLASLIW